MQSSSEARPLISSAIQLVSWQRAVFAVIAAIIIYSLSILVYNVFFHPLRSFPGPLLHRATVLGRCYDLVAGHLPFKVLEHHQKYGPVVRIAPNELAFSSPEAWKDIYTRKKASADQYELPHDWEFYNRPADPQKGSILESHREVHDVLRKELAPAFSDRALKAQESTIKGYAELLMRRLEEHSRDSNTGKLKAVDLTNWFAYSTFDIAGFLTFGSDFGCLEDATFHPWVALVRSAVRDLSSMAAMRSFSRKLFEVVVWVVQKTGVAAKAHALHEELSETKTRARVDLGTGRDDLLNAWIARGMPFDQLKQNASLLIIAGSETSATAITALLYFALSQPDIYRSLRDEVRSTFSSTAEITYTSLTQLPYMHAALSETLRVYPPVPIALTREVPGQGAEISGSVVPPGTIVGIWHYAINRDKEFFTNPHKFDPERWLAKDGSIYANDCLDANKPFLVGPRNCLGMSLAYFEMKLLLAMLLFHYDVELCEESKDWMGGQKVWFLWDKAPLNVILRNRLDKQL